MINEDLLGKGVWGWMVEYSIYLKEINHYLPMYFLFTSISLVLWSASILNRVLLSIYLHNYFPYLIHSYFHACRKGFLCPFVLSDTFLVIPRDSSCPPLSSVCVDHLLWAPKLHQLVHWSILWPVIHHAELSRSKCSYLRDNYAPFPCYNASSATPSSSTSYPMPILSV